MDVRLLLFDVGGSVFDWRSALAEAVATAASPEIRALDPIAFSTAW